MEKIENVEKETIQTDAELVYQQIEWDLNDSSVMESSESWLNKSQIAKFYSGKHIFITGATGFMGLALVEKLLRACPDIAAMYLLIRPKYDKTTQERVDALFENILFQKLHRKRGKSFYKCVVPIIGDVEDINLGISNSDAEMLASRIDIIFHAAANVKFNKPISTMVKINIRGIKYVVELAKRSKNLKALIHVSTAYSNCKLSFIEEKFYKPNIEPYKIIEIVEKANKNELSSLTKKLIDGYPNTYAFCKQVGEDLIKHCGLPSCVFRPGVVTTSYEEPIAGWTENLAGPSALIIGIGLGIIRIILKNENTIADLIPVDMSINAMIACAWDVAQKQTLESPKPIVYNNVSSPSHILTSEYLAKEGIKIGRNIASMNALWYIETIFIKNPLLYWFFFLLLHVIPGAIIDGILYFRNQKTKMLEIYRKLYNTNEMITYFALHTWRFGEDNLRSVIKRMSKADAHAFPADVKNINWHEFIRRMSLGLRVYKIQDPVNTVPAGRARMRKLKFIHYLVKDMVLLYFLYYLCKKLIDFVLTRWFL